MFFVSGSVHLFALSTLLVCSHSSPVLNNPQFMADIITGGAPLSLAYLPVSFLSWLHSHSCIYSLYVYMHPLACPSRWEPSCWARLDVFLVCFGACFGLTSPCPSPWTCLNLFSACLPVACFRFARFSSSYIMLVVGC